jgi:hypothetical protein
VTGQASTRRATPRSPPGAEARPAFQFGTCSDLSEQAETVSKDVVVDDPPVTDCNQADAHDVDRLAGGGHAE